MEKQKEKRTPRNRMEEYMMTMHELEEKQKKNNSIPFDQTVETNILLHEVNKTLCLIFDLAAMAYNLHLAPKDGEPQ